MSFCFVSHLIGCSLFLGPCAGELIVGDIRRHIAISMNIKCFDINSNGYSSFMDQMLRINSYLNVVLSNYI